MMINSLWLGGEAYSTPKKESQQTVKHKVDTRVWEGVKAVLRGSSEKRRLRPQMQVREVSEILCWMPLACP
jgi:hypothetical protein